MADLQVAAKIIDLGTSAARLCSKLLGRRRREDERLRRLLIQCIQAKPPRDRRSNVVGCETVFADGTPASAWLVALVPRLKPRRSRWFRTWRSLRDRFLRAGASGFDVYLPESEPTEEEIGTVKCYEERFARP